MAPISTTQLICKGRWAGYVGGGHDGGGHCGAVQGAEAGAGGIGEVFNEIPPQQERARGYKDFEEPADAGARAGRAQRVSSSRESLAVPRVRVRRATMKDLDLLVRHRRGMWEAIAEMPAPTLDA